MKRAVWVAVLLPFLAGWTWPWTLDRLAGNGHDQYGRGDFGGAAKSYDEAVKEAGDRPDLLYNLGTSQLAAGDYAGATDTLGRVRTNDLELKAHAAYNKGNALYRLGQYEAAAESYRAALRADPLDADAEHNLDLCLRHRTPLAAVPLTPKEPKQDPQKNEGKGGGGSGANPNQGAASQMPPALSGGTPQQNPGGSPQSSAGTAVGPSGSHGDGRDLDTLERKLRDLDRSEHTDRQAFRGFVHRHDPTQRPRTAQEANDQLRELFGSNNSPNW